MRSVVAHLGGRAILSVRGDSFWRATRVEVIPKPKPSSLAFKMLAHNQMMPQNGKG
jgi:hypothetical protein